MRRDGERVVNFEFNLSRVINRTKLVKDICSTGQKNRENIINARKEVWPAHFPLNMNPPPSTPLPHPHLSLCPLFILQFKAISNRSAAIHDPLECWADLRVSPQPPQWVCPGSAPLGLAVDRHTPARQDRSPRADRHGASGPQAALSVALAHTHSYINICRHAGTLLSSMCACDRCCGLIIYVYSSITWP